MIQYRLLCVLPVLWVRAASRHHADFYTGVRFPGEEGIIGGEDTDIRQVPYQLALQWHQSNGSDEAVCGAAIFGPQDVVTAAHCVAGRQSEEVTFRAGSSFRMQGGSIHQATLILVHPLYNFPHYDVAYVRVEPAFIYGDTVRPVDLAKEEPLGGTEVLVTGWGIQTFQNRSVPVTLQRLKLSIVRRKKCLEIYGAGIVTADVICAGSLVEGSEGLEGPEGAGGQSSCDGDSGGPLVSANNMVGVVSFRSSLGCDRPGLPSGFANVALLRAWLLAQVAVPTSKTSQASVPHSKASVSAGGLLMFYLVLRTC